MIELISKDAKYCRKCSVTQSWRVHDACRIAAIATSWKNVLKQDFKREHCSVIVVTSFTIAVEDMALCQELGANCVTQLHTEIN